MESMDSLSFGVSYHDDVVLVWLGVRCMYVLYTASRVRCSQLHYPAASVGIIITEMICFIFLHSNPGKIRRAEATTDILQSTLFSMSLLTNLISTTAICHKAWYVFHSCYEQRGIYLNP